MNQLVELIVLKGHLLHQNQSQSMRIISNGEDFKGSRVTKIVEQFPVHNVNRLRTIPESVPKNMYSSETVPYRRKRAVRTKW